MRLVWKRSGPNCHTTAIVPGVDAYVRRHRSWKRLSAPWTAELFGNHFLAGGSFATAEEAMEVVEWTAHQKIFEMFKLLPKRTGGIVSSAPARRKDRR